MKKPRLSIIAAVAENNVIGRRNALPWYIPEDLKHFRKLTLNHTVIMGRRTYESIGKPLPKRNNIVITRDKAFTAPHCYITHSIDEALAYAHTIEPEEIFIIGGSNIYEQTINRAERLYLTLVHKKIAGDVYFPPYDIFHKVLSKERHKNPDYSYSFVVLER